MTDDDCVSNPSKNESFQEVVTARLSRRSFLGGSVVAATFALSGIGSLLRAIPAQAHGAEAELGFSGIPVSAADSVVVPEGYTARVLIAWGDPISNGPAFSQDASNTADEQAQQWGMHNDGVVYFPIDGSHHGLLVQNHEYTDDGLLFRDGVLNWTAEKTSKALNAHGVSVIEIRKGHGHDNDGEWHVVRPSKYARRITGQTPIQIVGPAAGDPRLKTSADPSGRLVLGTLNNCAMGFTPWGTYLACEENFNGYFQRTLDNRTPLELRYGIAPFSSGFRFHSTHPRFNADLEKNEPNRFGWVVEINPFKPKSMPVKRTALGRLKHEGAWVQETKDGHIVVYMGDDERNEYIYRYVSNQPWRKAVRRGISPLDDGILYVAKFKADGTGEWLPLTPDNPALATWSLADILINTRARCRCRRRHHDGSAGVDRHLPRIAHGHRHADEQQSPRDHAGVGQQPRWLDGRRLGPPTGGRRQPAREQAYGHIIRWTYEHDFSEPDFAWDIFAQGGDPTVPAHGSTIVGDKYGSPDGIYVAPSGRLWIQTDVSTSTINTGAYAGFGNNQMLSANPATGETRRFLVGPNQCEITGAFMTPDETALFVGIQHPGETADESPNDPANPKRFSSWPDGATGGRPRSACLVITRNDGGPIGGPSHGDHGDHGTH